MPIDNDSIKAASSALGKLASDVYSDLAQPATKQVGTALGTVAKVALSPFRLLELGYEASSEWLQAKVHARHLITPSEHWAAPRSSIAIGAITQIAMNHDAPELRELFAELLLKAMDTRTSDSVHPAYISLLSQLSAQEALVFLSLKQLSDDNAARRQGDSVFTHTWGPRPEYGNDSIEIQFHHHCKSLGFDDYDVAMVWLANLRRLSLVEVVDDSEVYLRDDENRGQEVRKTDTYDLFLTALGRGLIEICEPPGNVAMADINENKA